MELGPAGMLFDLGSELLRFQGAWSRIGGVALRLLRTSGNLKPATMLLRDSASGRCLRFVSVAFSLDVEGDGPLNYFFQSNPGKFMFGRIDFDARARATLQLLAAFGR